MGVKPQICACLLACVSVFLAPRALAEKTDVVTLTNGDRLTGEVKSLDRGLLNFKTDTMGTVQIEWNKIARVESRLLFEVELSSGERHFGSLGPAPGAGRLMIGDAGGDVTVLGIADTVRIAQMDTAGPLRDRVDGYLDFGYGYSDSTQIAQLSLGAGISRRNRKRLWDFDLAVAESDAPGTRAEGTASLSSESRRFFGNRLFWSGLGRLERNDQPGLDRRALVGGGLGRYLVQASNREIAGLAVFPSLTISGRVRTAANIKFRYEFVKDLFAQIAITHAYDSKPQSVGAETRDYTLTTSIGYTF